MKGEHFVRLNSPGSAKPVHGQIWGHRAQWGAEGLGALGAGQGSSWHPSPPQLWLESTEKRVLPGLLSSALKSSFFYPSDL